MRTSRVQHKTSREIDGGERCERHVGEVFPSRCFDCDRADSGARIDGGETERLSAIIGRSGYIPGTHCPLHANYPLPCDRCKRDVEQGPVAA